MFSYQERFTKFSRKKILVCFLLLLVSVSTAQVDSLATKTYSELRTLFKSAIEEDAKRAFEYAKAAYVRVASTNKKQQIGESLYFLAKANTDLSQNRRALEQLSEVIAIANQLKDSSLLFKGNVLKGNVYNDLGEESNALAAYLEADKSSGYSEKSSDLILLSINIAYIKKLHRDYEDAVAILKENLNLLETITIAPDKKKRYELIILMNLTDTYLRMTEDGNLQNIVNAEFYNEKGLEKCQYDQNSVFYYVLWMNQAIIHFEKGAYEESIAVANDVKEKAIATNNEGLTCTAYFYLGKNYFQLKKYTESIRFFNQAYDIMKTSERRYSNEILLHQLLTKNYIQIENIEKANFHLEIFTKLVNDQSIEDLKVQSMIHQKFDIDKLKKQVEKLEIKVDDQKKRKIGLYVASGILVILLLASIVFYRRKVRKINEKMVQVMKKVEELEQSKVKTTAKTQQRT
ncbi:MAG: tetratricopeptide repeat protein, partial [Bacteroidota bacterium]